MWKSYQDMQAYVLERYDKHKRSLPRRDSFDQYKVLVSESMLQQTQVERVIPKFHARMDAFPTMKSLAEASVKDLLTYRSWLGFNARALRLQQTAKQIIQDYNGILPSQREILRTLPGIWAYTSASLLAFVYNLPAPVVDTNIRRVYIWLLDLEQTITPHTLEKIVSDTIPQWRANDWFNALMDIGATLLTTKKTWIKPRSKQSRFVWSPRQVRWAIIRHLIQHGQEHVHTLKREFAHTHFDQIVVWLQQDGLVVCDNEYCRLPQENA
jgi:A/G-specific adenine glycosylase